MSELITVADFKKNPRVGVLLRKEFTVEVKADGEAPVEIIISTAAVDRVGDTIAVDGWRLENYRKNPVVLFAHDPTQFPVGRSLKEWTDDNALRSLVEFTPRDMNPMGASVGAMVRGGFLRAASVGFEPLEWKANEERASHHWWGPAIDYLKQELLEYSMVPIPANPEALVAAKAAGIDITPIREWAKRVRDSMGDDAPPTRAELKGLLESTIRATLTSITVDLGAHVSAAIEKAVGSIKPLLHIEPHVEPTAPSEVAEALKTAFAEAVKPRQ